MTLDIRSLVRRLDQCMLADRPRLRRLLRALRRGQARSAHALRQRIEELFEQSARQRAQRARTAPRPELDASLPIAACADQIARAIEQHPVVVVCGPTGCGKTTQLPLICLRLGRGVAGMIGHTQPRRLAARALAARLSHLLHAPPDTLVACRVRFDDRTGPDTRVKIMTDGILLGETHHDPLLLQYDTVIIDEAHERSLNIDFLLGYLRQLLPRRPDLKIIITSATIEPLRFAGYFGGVDRVPVIEVATRLHPVEVRYRPPSDADADLSRAVLEAVDELLGVCGGDVLVFLTGEREIRATAEALRGRLGPGVDVLPLYARLPLTDQARIFSPQARPRVILATNVAETSLTVPRVRGVVDTGLVRLARYAHRTGVQRLPIEPVSQASAQQRAGRCGREAPGICIRLYSEDDFARRPPCTEPEILRTSLASVVLRMKHLRLGDVRQFPFMDAPDPALIREGLDTLAEVGAIDATEALTPLGEQMARLPVDVRIARMLLAGGQFGCAGTVLTIASGLAIQDPRQRPMDRRDAADQAHARWHDPDSDFLALWRLWNEYRQVSATKSAATVRAWCRDHFLSLVRLREWEDVRADLQEHLADMGLPWRDVIRSRRSASRQSSRGEAVRRDPWYAAIHRALLAGLLTRVGVRAAEEHFEYAGVRGLRFAVHPASGLFRDPPRWVVAAELIHTTRLYAATVARIDPRWIEPLAPPHLLRRTHDQPHWSREHGEARAYERVSLLGLEIVSRRRVPLAPLDPHTARDVFIREGLVHGEVDADWSFLERNRRLLADARAVAARARKVGVIADTDALADFYHARLPATVHSVATLNAHLRACGREAASRLLMRWSDVASLDPDPYRGSRFPDTLDVHGTALPLTYVYDPGSPVDGVTVTIPIELLPVLEADQFDWLVPGLLEQRILALLRGLPRPLRKALDPIPPLAAECAASIHGEQGSLLAALERQVRDRRGVCIPRQAWRPDLVPEYLRLNFRVVDHEGRELAQGRDLHELRRRLAPDAREAFRRLMQSVPFSRRGLRAWDIDELPERFEIARGGISVVLYPALIDEGESVGLSLMATRARAAAATAGGVVRLAALQTREAILRQLRQTFDLERFGLLYGPLGGPEALRLELIDLLARRAFLEHACDQGRAMPRTRDEFHARVQAGLARLNELTAESAPVIAHIIALRHRVALRLGDDPPPQWCDTYADAREQLLYLTPRGFLARTPWARLRHLPRYLAGLDQRLEATTHGSPGRERRLLARIRPFWVRYTEFLARRAAGEDGSGQPGMVWSGLVAGPDLAVGPDPVTRALDTYRWMVEEYRLALFAPRVGPTERVSERRLETAWQAVLAAADLVRDRSRDSDAINRPADVLLSEEQFAPDGETP